jgi:hypothetical protein
VTTLYGALMAHGLDDGLDGTFASVSLFLSQDTSGALQTAYRI